MITKIAHFTCSVVKQPVTLEMLYSQVPGYADIHTGYGHCSREAECAVAAEPAGGKRFDRSACPYICQRLSLPGDIRVTQPP